MSRGKDCSISRGLEQTQGDIIVVQDTDFEYDPSELPRLLEPILAGRAQVIYGSRFLAGGMHRGMTFPNYIANRFMTWMTNFLYRIRLTDMETRYKIVLKSLMMSLGLSAHRFDFAPEITAKLSRKGVRIIELPIRYSGRAASEGGKIKARDFFVALKILFANRFLS